MPGFFFALVGGCHSNCARRAFKCAGIGFRLGCYAPKSAPKSVRLGLFGIGRCGLGCAAFGCSTPMFHGVSDFGDA